MLGKELLKLAIRNSRREITYVNFQENVAFLRGGCVWGRSEIGDKRQLRGVRLKRVSSAPDLTDMLSRSL